jgi:molybdopterin-dependent oxidoreductase alpha subunit
MGGQLGGMRNEAGRWPEVCKKSMQAMAADMQGSIRPEFFERYSIAELRVFTPREMESAGRLTTPVIAEAGATHYRPISWESALALAADRLKESTPDQTFFYFSGRSSNEAAFLMQLFARLYGTNNVNNCSYYCHQASGVGLAASVGTSTATITLEDVDHADLIFLIGGNPASNHPRLLRSLMDLRRRGGEVIVINPLKETGLVNFRVPSDVKSLLFGSPIASQYIQPLIGGDIALLVGIAKEVLERGAEDVAYLERHTAGFEAFRDWCLSTAWEEIEAKSGVSRHEIVSAADRFARAQRVIFAWTMGITHHEHGVDNVQMIANLAFLRGMVGRPGTGLLPIRGHSNVQGIGSMGVTPVLKEKVFTALEQQFGVRLPTKPGADTFACMEQAHQGEVRVAWCLGGNLFGSNPDANYAAEALGRVGSVIYMSTSLNTGHAWGTGRETLILPVLARDEERQSTTQESMFNFVRLSDGGIARHTGPKGEVEIIASVARHVLGDDGPIDWRQMQQHSTIRSAIAKVIPGYERLGDIDTTKREFQIDGRTFHEPHFPTPSGRGNFAVPRIPDGRRPHGTLSLMTIRSEGQFNTVVYEEEDLYRGQEGRDIVMMNADDIARMGLRENQRVWLRSRTGTYGPVLVRPFDIHGGCAAVYYPEANVLVPAAIDPKSKTPAFKSIDVEVSVDDPLGTQRPGAFVPSQQLAAGRS